MLLFLPGPLFPPEGNRWMVAAPSRIVGAPSGPLEEVPMYPSRSDRIIRDSLGIKSSVLSPGVLTLCAPVETCGRLIGRPCLPEMPISPLIAALGTEDMFVYRHGVQVLEYGNVPGILGKYVTAGYAFVRDGG